MSVAYEPPPTASANTSGVPYETSSQLCVLLLVFARTLVSTFSLSLCSMFESSITITAPLILHPPVVAVLICPIQWRIFADARIVV
jgi:hypothetical protein